MADFDSWSKESLVRFAQDATQRMGEQTQRIETLQTDLRAAMRAYRELVSRETAEPPLPRP